MITVARPEQNTRNPDRAPLGILILKLDYPLLEPTDSASWRVGDSEQSNIAGYGFGHAYTYMNFSLEIYDAPCAWTPS